MIYLDSSVALAYLLAADRFPLDEPWDEQLVSGRLPEGEVWTRINANLLQSSYGEVVRNLIGRVAIIEMVGPVLARALQPFPISVRTLDAIHLAALEFSRWCNLHREDRSDVAREISLGNQAAGSSTRQGGRGGAGQQDGPDRVGGAGQG